MQDVGDGSRSLATLRPGTRVLVEGPHGRLTERARTRPGVVLIGAGVGMAPLRALAEGLTYAYGDAVLVHRYTRDELFAAELAGLQHARGLRVVRLPGRRRHPRAWTPPTYADGSPLSGSDLDVLRSGCRTSPSATCSCAGPGLGRPGARRSAQCRRPGRPAPRRDLRVVTR